MATILIYRCEIGNLRFVILGLLFGGHSYFGDVRFMILWLLFLKLYGQKDLALQVNTHAFSHLTSKISYLTDRKTKRLEFSFKPLCFSICSRLRSEIFHYYHGLFYVCVCIFSFAGRVRNVSRIYRRIFSLLVQVASREDDSYNMLLR